MSIRLSRKNRASAESRYATAVAATRLESSCPASADAPVWDRAERPVRLMRYGAGMRIAAHQHRRAYAALVMEGSFEEAGNRGRRRIVAGDVIVHAAFDAHRDLFAARGAIIVNVALPDALGARCAGAWRAGEIDRLARLAFVDAPAATAALVEGLATPAPRGLDDWPDRLADTLARCPQTDLGAWARAHGLAASSVARGFHRAYGVTASAFRAESRARQAVQRLALADSSPLGELAFELGFADQAHMTRAVGALTGITPGRLRRGADAAVQA